jgi:hypothetical protein
MEKSCDSHGELMNSLPNRWPQLEFFLVTDITMACDETCGALCLSSITFFSSVLHLFVLLFVRIRANAGKALQTMQISTKIMQ